MESLKLEDGLDDRTTCRSFFVFLRERHQEECLLFWLDTEVYKTLQTTQRRKDMAAEMYQKYFGSQSKYFIQIAPELLEVLDQEFETADISLFSLIQRSLVSTVLLSSFRLFLEANPQILQDILDSADDPSSSSSHSPSESPSSSPSSSSSSSKKRTAQQLLKAATKKKKSSETIDPFAKKIISRYLKKHKNVSIITDSPSSASSSQPTSPPSGSSAADGTSSIVPASSAPNLAVGFLGMIEGSNAIKSTSKKQRDAKDKDKDSASSSSSSPAATSNTAASTSTPMNTGSGGGTVGTGALSSTSGGHKDKKSKKSKRADAFAASSSSLAGSSHESLVKPLSLSLAPLASSTTSTSSSSSSGEKSGPTSPRASPKISPSNGERHSHKKGDKKMSRRTSSSNIADEVELSSPSRRAQGPTTSKSVSGVPSGFLNEFNSGLQINGTTATGAQPNGRHEEGDHQHNRHSSSSSSSSSSPAQPAKIKMATQDQQALANFVLSKEDGYSIIDRLLTMSVRDDILDETSKSLIVLTLRNDVALDFIAHWFEKEASQFKGANATLFRTDSPATTLMSKYMWSTADFYLAHLLAPLLKRQNDSFEIDFTQGPNANIGACYNKILELAQLLLEQIKDSAYLCPPNLRALFRAIMTAVDKHVPEMGTTIVGSLLFLRFLCPAIVAPEHYGLLDTAPSPQFRRVLVIVSKLIQNIVNDVDFDGTKEVHMTVFNTFLSDENKRDLRLFIEALVITEHLKLESDSHFVTTDESSIALHHLYKYLLTEDDLTSLLVPFIRSPRLLLPFVSKTIRNLSDASLDTVVSSRLHKKTSKKRL